MMTAERLAGETLSEARNFFMAHCATLGGAAAPVGNAFRDSQDPKIVYAPSVPRNFQGGVYARETGPDLFFNIGDTGIIAARLARCRFMPGWAAGCAERVVLLKEDLRCLEMIMNTFGSGALVVYVGGASGDSSPFHVAMADEAFSALKTTNGVLGEENYSLAFSALRAVESFAPCVPEETPLRAVG